MEYAHYSAIVDQTLPVYDMLGTNITLHCSSYQWDVDRPQAH